jgi:DNA-binding IclR family transcriptional regulator
VTPERDSEMVLLQRRIAGEYREMPGLSLTLTQAARLWGLDPATTQLLLGSLTEENLLFRTVDGVYRLPCEP